MFNNNKTIKLIINIIKIINFTYIIICAMMFVKKRQEERYVQAVSLQVSAYAFPQILSASSLNILAVPPAWRLRRWGSAAMQRNIVRLRVFKRADCEKDSITSGILSFSYGAFTGLHQMFQLPFQQRKACPAPAVRR